MKYSFSFIGRQARAIGIQYRIRDTYKCDSLSEAKSLLYEDYELIKGVSINDGEITKEEFDKADFIPVRSNTERQRNPTNGSYLYTRTDSPQIKEHR